MAKNPDLTSTAPGGTDSVENKTNGVEKTPAKRTRKAKCENSVKCAESSEILNGTARIEEQEPKKTAQYKQRKSNQDVRQDAALEYIERNTKPRPARDKTKHLLTSDAQLNMEPGDNARYVMFGMAIYNMAPIDINDVDQVESRIQEYFALCIQADMKPGVANLAMALGIDRHRLLDVVNDVEGRSVVPAGVRSALKKAHAYMGSYWEQIMQNGKINPASGIFLGKNNFGYRDQTEHVLTPNVKTSDTISPADLSRRIDALPDD